MGGNRGGPGRRGAVLGLLRDLLGAFGHRRWSGGRLLVPIVAVLFGGAWLFSRVQHTTFFTALYWAVTTATTVGYGDVAPANARARLVAMGMMVLAVPLLGLGLADLASHLVEGRLRSVLGMGRSVYPAGYTLVLAWTPSSRVAVNDLLARGRVVVVVADVDGLGQESPRLHFVHGDPADEHLLTTLGPQRARACLLCHERDGDMLVAAVALHRLAPHLPLMAAPARAGTAQAMRELGIAVGFPVSEFIGYVLARGSETPHAGALLWQIVAGDDRVLREFPVAQGEAGRRLGEVSGGRAAHGELVVGLLRGGEVRLAGAEEVLEADDRILAFVRKGG